MQMLMANDMIVIQADKKTPQQYHDMSKYAASGWHCKATCGSQRAATKRLRHKHRKLKHKAVFYSVSFWFYMPQECWSLCHSKAEKPSWQLWCHNKIGSAKNCPFCFPTLQIPLVCLAGHSIAHLVAL